MNISNNNKQNATKQLRSSQVVLEDDVNLTDFVVKIEQNVSPSPSSSPSSLVMNLEAENENSNDDDVDMNGDDIEDEEKSDSDGLFDIRLVSPMSWSLDNVKTEHEELDIPANSSTPPPSSSPSSSAQTIIQHTSLSQLLAAPSTPKTILNRINTKLPATIPGGATIKIKRSQEQLQQQQQQQMKQLELQRTSDSASPDKKYRVLLQNAKVRKESLEHSSDMIYNADLEKPWVCRNCNRTYKWKNSLKCHLKNECGQPPRFFCKKMCGYATNVHSNLKRHLNTKCRDREDDMTERYEITLENN